MEGSVCCYKAGGCSFSSSALAARLHLPGVCSTPQHLHAERSGRRRHTRAVQPTGGCCAPLRRCARLCVRCGCRRAEGSCTARWFQPLRIRLLSAAAGTEAGGWAGDEKQRSFAVKGQRERGQRTAGDRDRAAARPQRSSGHITQSLSPPLPSSSRTAPAPRAPTTPSTRHLRSLTSVALIIPRELCLSPPRSTVISSPPAGSSSSVGAGHRGTSIASGLRLSLSLWLCSV